MDTKIYILSAFIFVLVISLFGFWLIHLNDDDKPATKPKKSIKKNESTHKHKNTSYA